MKLEVSTEDLRKYSIMVGTPMYGGQCDGLYCKSTNELSKLCALHGIPLKFYYLFNESLIQRARNYVVDEFIRSDATHLMFIDADIGFNPSDVLSLLAIQTSFPDKYDILTAPYPKKTIAWEKVKAAVQQGRGDNPFDLASYAADYVFNPAPGIESFRIDEPLPVSEGGTGFMLIPRSVFERYEKAYPEYRYRPDHVRTANFDGSREIMAYFDCQIDPESKRYLSEDYFFCRNAGKVGIKTHMCPWMNLLHVGSYIYRGSMVAMASLGVSQTADLKSNEKSYKNMPVPVKGLQPNKKKLIKGFRP